MGIGNFISGVLGKKKDEDKEGEQIKKAVVDETAPVEEAPIAEAPEESSEPSLREEVEDIQSKVERLDEQIEVEEALEKNEAAPPMEAPAVGQFATKSEIASLKKRVEELNAFIKAPKKEVKDDELKKLEKKVLDEVAKHGPAAVDTSKFSTKKELVEAEKRLIESFKVAQVKAVSNIDTSVFVKKSELAPIKGSLASMMKLITGVMKSPSVSKDELDAKLDYVKSGGKKELKEFAAAIGELDRRLKAVEEQASGGAIESVRQDFEALSNEIETKIKAVKEQSPADVNALRDEINELREMVSSSGAASERLSSLATEVKDIREAISKAADVESVSAEIDNVKQTLEEMRGSSPAAAGGDSHLEKDFEELKGGVEEEMQKILSIVSKFREALRDFATKEDLAKNRMGDPQVYETLNALTRNTAAMEQAMKRWEQYFSNVSQRLDQLEGQTKRRGTIIE